MTKARLTQDPHKTGAPSTQPLEVAIGRAVRKFRTQQKLTVAELSRLTGLSIGMLSKIESGSTSPSLTTLQSLSNALRVPLTAFFRGFEEKREFAHTPAGSAVEVERPATRAGHQYKLLGHITSHASGVIVEPYLITLTDQSDTFPSFQHDGIELLYMIEGELDYRHDKQSVRMKPGDTLLFEADAPHGPHNYVRLPARFLSIIAYPIDD
ncbi:MAG: XRE family transcriptional regulator [Roseitalea porphyridii]|uniref:helix-turn-helix domain-containing protein n=1 Tax=Roseitalea porphyridii TaxID=1852022 RepID=UPI0032D8E63D